MRIALVITPLSDENLRLAKQIGVSDVVGRYPGLDYMELVTLRSRIADAGLRLSVIEGYLPIDKIKFGTAGRDEEIEQVQTLVRNMGAAGVEILCYNFMSGGDWSRTSFTTPTRGGARVSSYDPELMAKAPLTEAGTTTDEKMWENLEYFLKRVVPVAEEAGVKLAMHPDDPPIPTFRGMARIMRSVEAFERLVETVPSPANGICFCQGCFAEIDVDVPATIRRLAKHIHFVHFRDVRGCVPKFVETFHDDGKTDMFAAMRTYKEIGFAGPMRPDHVPLLEGEPVENPGYTMPGRLWAVGYMKGLIDAVNSLG
jgi:mannonate dehydratase